MRLTLLAITVMATALAPFVTDASDPAAKRSAEWQVLDRFVGIWDFEVTNKLPSGEVVRDKTSETRKWTLGGKFVHFENTKAQRPDDPEFQMLVTYDPATKTYPGMLMSGASRSVVDGTWDETTKTMTFRGASTDNSGTKFVYASRFFDNGDCETNGVIKDAAGKVLVEQRQKQTRRQQ